MNPKARCKAIAVGFDAALLDAGRGAKASIEAIAALHTVSAGGVARISGFGSIYIRLACPAVDKVSSGARVSSGER